MNTKPIVAKPEANAKPRARLAPASPVLRFSPTAWAKLLFFCHHGKTEIGGFGITAADNLLHIQDFQTVEQAVTVASVAFDDDAVADFFDQQVDDGRKPEQFARIWLHTHPGDSAIPSSTDEETFARVFGCSDWAIMFILSRTGRVYARMRFNVGPGGQIQIPVEVAYSEPFAGSDHEAWKQEYKANVYPEPGVFGFPEPCNGDGDWLYAEPGDRFEAAGLPASEDLDTLRFDDSMAPDEETWL